MDQSLFKPTRECVCTALRKASRAVTQHYEASFRGSGLRATQFTVLSTLAQTGAMPVSKLAAFLGMERTTLTRNLGPLEKRGLVEVVSDDGDARVRRVAITRAGENAARDGLAAWRKAQASVPRVLKQLGLADFPIAPLS
jgi:DNA-binding MarR family transcriptional regulator